MPDKKAKNPPVTNIKKTEPAAPSRTAADSLALMFRRGINGSHNKGKQKMLSTKERITRDEFHSVGDDFVTLFDHDTCKKLEPLVHIIQTEANPKLERFYCTEEMLSPTYVPTPFEPKSKTKAPPATPTTPKPTKKSPPAKKAKKPAAAVTAPPAEKKKRAEKQPKK